MDKPITVIVSPCQHAYMCATCSEKTETTDTCNICRCKITKRDAIYMSGVDDSSTSRILGHKV